MSSSASDSFPSRGIMLVRTEGSSFGADSPGECIQATSAVPTGMSEGKDDSPRCLTFRAAVMAVNKRNDIDQAEKASLIQDVFREARSRTVCHKKNHLAVQETNTEERGDEENSVGEQQEQHCNLDGCKMHLKRDSCQQQETDVALPPIENLECGKFPGKGAPSCKHYERKCWLKAVCCGKYYPCRRCHDEAEDHAIDRHATERIGCTSCGAEEQPIGRNCAACGAEFASYFCAICRFYDDGNGKEIYHCDKCGMCRVGKGVGIDNHHCTRCNSCVPIEVATPHPCIERSLEGDCPICSEYLATSVEQVVFMRCGHAMHAACFTQHTATRYTCPICSKSLTDMSAWYRGLDERLASEILPSEYARKRSRILCHDCESKTTTTFHFMFHKCQSCGGYNTRVLSHIEPEEIEFCSTADGIQEAAANAHERCADAMSVTATAGIPCNSVADDDCSLKTRKRPRCFKDCSERPPKSFMFRGSTSSESSVDSEQSAVRDGE
jgi:hypothetical protein